MKKLLLLGGAAMAIAFASYTAAVPASYGWGAPFAPGEGAQCKKINWNQDAPTPSEKPAAPVLTGIAAPKATESEPESEWTVEQLKAGKPMMLYAYIDEKKPMEENYKFSRKAEFSAFSSAVVDLINQNWVAKKIEIDSEADRKLPQNQARIEFWSFTGKRLDSVTQKNEGVLEPANFQAKLKDMQKKNRDLCNAEIKRIQDEAARRAKDEQDLSAK